MKRNIFAIIKSKAAAAKSKNKPPFTLDDDYRKLVCSHAYIGKKGYTLSKSVLKPEDVEHLRAELTVKPEVFGAQFGPSTTESAFPVFRENEKKMYIPRFYGISRYGLPPRCDMDAGEDIADDVKFVKDVRDYQEVIINTYLDHVRRPICHGSPNQGNGGILQVFTGAGKTVLSIKIISEIRKKTLILVHKEFLMNQWIERIQEFMPTARIGKIQGKVCDTQDKDIVIGMIQSIYDKDYPANTFSQFGMTIVDEVHRIGSEQFSKTLLKTVTPYMLGISATVDRKDKLTKVLYMFIGEKIYSNVLRGDDVVSVRAIEYKTADKDFNEVEFDFRGTPQYSKMIVKLCEFGPRSDFIVRVVADLLAEHPENQIMILGHNRSLLTYLHDTIQHRKIPVEGDNDMANDGIATVGYYLGGMKTVALQETEKKNVVIATYAMAAEALDIKTLATLVMVTPKTDIVQSVGRILRTKHENTIIVDIVDGHELFQNQWKQRMRYYKKCNYRIHKIDSTQYRGFVDFPENTPSLQRAKLVSGTPRTLDTWKRIFEPKEVKKTVVDDDDDDAGPASIQHGVGIGKCLISFTEEAT
jgi:superfamily II DNA or RNA helicase